MSIQIWVCMLIQICIGVCVGNILKSDLDLISDLDTNLLFDVGLGLSWIWICFCVCFAMDFVLFVCWWFCNLDLALVVVLCVF